MQFNFSDVWWLALILAIPVVTALYALYYRGRVALDRLKAFADAHLLPHLLKNKTAMQHSIARPLILWSIIWACGALAMAGPRWNYTDVQTGTPNRSLIILLDLSKSMDAQDVKPSRLERAKQEIGDIIDASHATSIGLIAFAAIPHMVVPLTDDMATIRYLMPSLDTGLVGVQGSRLAPALEMAGLMLRTAPGKDKSILVVSDGGMVDLADATQAIPEGVHVYAMGMGTSEGAPIPKDGGGWIERRNGDVVIAVLEADKLQAVADAGKGIYVAAEYTDSDTHALLSHIEAGPDPGTTKKGRTVRIWDEKFYIPALVMALIMLPWFRRGYVFPVVLLLMFWPAPARADLGDLFMNQAQQARAAYDQRDYEGAAQKFDTPYRRGVSQYRAQQFDKAEQSFAQDNDPKTTIDSEYNKGNAQLMQGKADDAIASYEDVLKQRPGDQAAAKNLEIAKKLREQQQKKDDQKDQKQDQKKDQQKDAKNDQKQDKKQDKLQNQKQQDKQQQQAQNNQQQGKGDDQQQKDKQGQQQQKDQNGQKQQQDKQGEHQQTGQQQQADNGQQQDKQQQDQKQQGDSSQNGQQGQQNQAQNDQNQNNQQQEQNSQDKNKQQQAQNGDGDQQGQNHSEQQQGEPDKGKGQQQAQNGDGKDENKNNNQPQDQKGGADQKNAQNDQKSPPQPGSAEDKKNRAEHNGASEKQAQDQKGGGNDKDKQQAGQQGKQDDQKQAQDQAQQQAPQTPEEDKQKQQEQSGQQAQGEDKQKEQQTKAAGREGKNEQPQNQQQPSYAQGNQDNSSAQQQQQQAYDSGQQTDSQSGSEHPGQVLNGQQRPRSQKDVDADQWLNRAVSDPGPFLRNQFNIDARKNPPPEEEDPW